MLPRHPTAHLFFCCSACARAGSPPFAPWLAAPSLPVPAAKDSVACRSDFSLSFCFFALGASATITFSFHSSNSCQWGGEAAVSS